MPIQEQDYKVLTGALDQMEFHLVGLSLDIIGASPQDLPSCMKILHDNPRTIAVALDHGITVKIARDPAKTPELLAEGEELRRAYRYDTEFLRFPYALEYGVVDGISFIVTETVEPLTETLIQPFQRLRKSEDDEGERQLCQLVVGSWPAFARLLESIIYIEHRHLQKIKVSGAAFGKPGHWYLGRLSEFGYKNFYADPKLFGRFEGRRRLDHAKDFFRYHRESFSLDYAQPQLAAAEPDHFVADPALPNPERFWWVGRLANIQLTPTFAYTQIQLIHRFSTKFAIPRHLGKEGRNFVSDWLDYVMELLIKSYNLTLEVARDHVMLAVLERFVGGYYSDWFKHQKAIKSGKSGGIGDLTLEQDHLIWYQLICSWYNKHR
jgi:hypothetical protein